MRSGYIKSRVVTRVPLMTSGLQRLQRRQQLAFSTSLEGSVIEMKSAAQFQ